MQLVVAIALPTAFIQAQTLVGYWRFDDGSGTTAADSSGNRHTATLFNGVSWVPGQIADAVSANASATQYVGIPAINLSATKTVTVAFWSKRTYSTVGGHTLLETTKNFNNSTTGFGIFPDDAQCHGIQASLLGNAGYTAMCYKQPTSGVWHHFAVIYDKTKAGKNEVTLFIDGVQRTPTRYLFVANNTNYFGNNPLYVFARGGTREFNSGIVDDLRLYNSALSAAQIQQIYSRGVCKLIANPSTISFPKTTIGYSSSFPATIVSECKRTISLSTIKVAGPPFNISGIHAPILIPSGKTTNYAATFAPTSVGTASGKITFTSDADDPTLSVSLTGVGVTSQHGLLTSSPASLSFGDVTVNTKQSQTVTVTNTGGEAVTVSAVRLAGAEFSMDSVTTPFTLETEQSKQLTIMFAPTIVGYATGTVTINSNAQNTLTIPLSGNGRKHYVNLTWTASTSPDVVGYDVFRSTNVNGPFTQINGSLISGTAYTDRAVQVGVTYYYVATAVNSQQVQSVYSNEAHATIP
jgi:hypothetical protein